jgi:hypothetical protein
MNDASHPNWSAISAPAFPWEREALDYVRDQFPTHEPYRAWSNFEFIADDGSLNEVDLLVFTPLGFFLVEIKSRPGVLSGDSHTWTWQHDGRAKVIDNPVFLANQNQCGIGRRRSATRRNFYAILGHRAAMERDKPLWAKDRGRSKGTLHCHHRGSKRNTAMDTELLVDDRIEDGRELLAQLAVTGFDITVAFWVRTSDEDLWFLYIASSAVARGSIGDAYGIVYSALSRLPNPSITLSDIKLVRPENPIAAAAKAVLDRYAAKIPTRYKGDWLGELAIEEAYIYPPMESKPDRAEILRTVAQLMNRTGPVQPSVVTLRDGSILHAIPVGLQARRQGAGIVVVVDDVTSGQTQSLAIDEITNIQ